MSTDPQQKVQPSAEVGHLKVFGLEETLERLKNVTHMLRFFGQWVVICAGLALTGVVAGVVMATVFRARWGLASKDAGLTSSEMVLLVSLVLAAQGIMTLFVWDQRKRRGSLYFEEISDELEWRHRGARSKGITVREIRATSVYMNASDPVKRSKPRTVEGSETPPSTPLNGNNSKKKRERPDLAIRVQLREFLDATSLPFTGANLSSTTYLLFFLLCIFTSLFVIMFTSYRG